VSEYLLNNRWVFNAGNYHDETGTFAHLLACSKDRNWPLAAVHITENLVFSMAAIHRKAEVRTLKLRIAAIGQQRTPIKASSSGL